MSLQAPSADRRSHPRVAAWLMNFAAARQDTAALLVASLKLVSETDFRREMGDLLDGLLTSLPHPIAAFPAREVDPPASAHAEGRDGDYAIFEKGFPGSEAITASILTSVLRTQEGEAALVEHLDLATLRDQKVRTLLLVDDFSGSGSRLVKFDRALRRHATIRSWASLKCIEVHVAVHYATHQAEKRLRRHFGKDNVHIVHACPTFASAGWTSEQLADVEALCTAKMSRRRSRMALGFGESRALIAFEHTAPNNLPKILWRSGDGWNHLFEGKAVPSDLLPLFTMAPSAPREPIPGSRGSASLGEIVDLLAHRVRHLHSIAEVTKISIPEIKRLLALLAELGLVGPKLRLTDKGLAMAKQRLAVREPRVLPNHEEPYYPSQLRAER